MICPNCNGVGWTMESDYRDPTGQTPTQVECYYDHDLLEKGR